MIIIGAVIIILGIFNMRGNIASIHRYHRHRVTEENVLPFGRLVGLGTVIIGVSVILFGLLSFLTEILKNDTYTLIGSVMIIVGLIIGMGLSFYAMIKYNKGIF